MMFETVENKADFTFSKESFVRSHAFQQGHGNSLLTER